jgi:hypothetical protein
MKFNQLIKSIKALLISSKIINCSYGEYEQLLVNYFKDKKVTYDFFLDLPKNDDLWDNFSRISYGALEYLLDYVNCNHQDKKEQSLAFLAIKKGVNSKIDIVLSNHTLNADEYELILSNIFNYQSSSHLNILHQLISHPQLNFNDFFANLLVKKFLEGTISFDEKLHTFDSILDNQVINKDILFIILEQWGELKKTHVVEKNAMFYRHQIKSENAHALDICLEKKILNLGYETPTKEIKKRIKI